MSKPGQPPARIDAQQQLNEWLALYRADIVPQTLERLAARARELRLDFNADELRLLAALDTPPRVQAFLNTQIYYNNDHATPDTEETVMSPLQVLRTARAHCFEGALFAYVVNTLHGHDPRLVLLEASQDSEHNLVLYRDPRSSLFGANAHSAFPHLDGRPAEYATVRALAESYQPWYYSDRSNDPGDLTLVGYSEPFDLVARFGTAWMGSEAQLWDIYYTYIDESVVLHYLFDDSGRSHPYALVRALRAGWIQIDAQGAPFVNTANLPADALPVWSAFWSAYGATVLRPYGAAREIERQFICLTGTTPIDLTENAADLVYFLEKGYRIEQLLAASTAQQPG